MKSCTMTSVPFTVLLFLSIFVLNSVNSVLSKRNSELKREILDQIVPKNDNEILVAPGNSTNGPTSVEVFMHVLGIDKLNEEKMEFTVRILLRQRWKDDRLNYENIKGSIKQITINDPEAVWTPDIFFSNEIKGRNFDITHPNLFIRIFPDGAVVCSRRLSITASCLMDLRRFPFDKQIFTLKMGAYGSTTDDVVLKWRDHAPVTLSRSAHLMLFSLEKVITHSGVNNINTGEYSYLALSFLLSRELGHYLYHTFIPCTMLVLTSWIPFWLNKKFLTARLLIGMATLLTGTLIIYDQNKMEAKLSYSTCMDCFTGTCLTIIFISIIETVVVHGLAQDEKGEEGDNITKDSVTNGSVQNEDHGKITVVKEWISKKIPQNSNSIDVGARFVVPLIYLLFCIIYFVSTSTYDDEIDLESAGNYTTEKIMHL